QFIWWHALRYSEGRADAGGNCTPFGVLQGVPPTHSYEAQRLRQDTEASPLALPCLARGRRGGSVGPSDVSGRQEDVCRVWGGRRQSAHRHEDELRAAG